MGFRYEVAPQVLGEAAEAAVVRDLGLGELRDAPVREGGGGQPVAPRADPARLVAEDRGDRL